MSIKLHLAITIDIDEDNFDKKDFFRRPMSWRGLEEGVPGMLGALAGYRDASGRPLKFTWFVRCDKRLEMAYSDPAHLFVKYADYWQERSMAGDEIAWHAHLYDHEPGMKDDEQRLVADFKESFAAAQKFGIKTSRLGRSFCTNSIMRTLDDLGIKADSTAMPGRKREDKTNKFNWENTPQAPFFPSPSDYRRPGEGRFDILEVPMSMIPIKAPYDKLPLNRYLNPTFRHEFLKEPLLDAVAKTDLLVMVLHPSELISGDKHPLLSFDPAEINKNIDQVFLQADITGKSISSITLAEVRELVQQGEIHAANN